MVEKVVAKKSLGQNFLTDPKISLLMVGALDIQENDQVIEIGAGTGAVTQYLASEVIKHGAHLTAVEFDIDLIPVLQSRIPEKENIKVVNANILNFLEGYTLPQETHLKIIGSLPYNITSPLLHMLTRYQTIPEIAVLLIQKEVAQKIAASAPDSSYLSVYLQTFFSTEVIETVDKNLFDPVPQVDGAILKLKKKETPPGTDIIQYEKFLHRAFSHPRKMLNKIYTSPELEKYHFEGSKRAQNYGCSEYLKAYLSST